ncbi:MAG: hypothetical protein ABIU05_02185 [Nitrospirales bacterium]
MRNNIEHWTSEKPKQTGWYGGLSILCYCGDTWDHVVDFAGPNEPIAFMKDRLLEGEWAGPLEPPHQDVTGRRVVSKPIGPRLGGSTV